MGKKLLCHIAEVTSSRCKYSE